MQKQPCVLALTRCLSHFSTHTLSVFLWSAKLNPTSCKIQTVGHSTWFEDISGWHTQKKVPFQLGGTVRFSTVRHTSIFISTTKIEKGTQITDLYSPTCWHPFLPKRVSSEKASKIRVYRSNTLNTHTSVHIPTKLKPAVWPRDEELPVGHWGPWTP